MINLALERPELSPRELAVTFTDKKAQFISEASVCLPSTPIKQSLTRIAQAVL
jgi:hypothetical protein